MEIDRYDPHLQYLSSDQIEYEASAIDKIKPGETQAELKAPTGEKPDDQGNPEVWIEPTVTFDDKNYYVLGKRNLVEGTEVSVNIDIPDKIVIRIAQMDCQQ